MVWKGAVALAVCLVIGCGKQQEPKEPPAAKIYFHLDKFTRTGTYTLNIVYPDRIWTMFTSTILNDNPPMSASAGANFTHLTEPLTGIERQEFLVDGYPLFLSQQQHFDKERKCVRQVIENKELAHMATANSIEVRIAKKEYKFTKEQIEALREFAEIHRKNLAHHPGDPFTEIP